MKALMICGAGKTTDELLKRLGESWQVILLDKEENRLTPFPSRFESIARIISGDASSPVVLEEAGIQEQDYVLALTDDDRVNLAVAFFAREKGIQNRMAVAHGPESVSRFQELGARVVLRTTLVAREIYHYLQNPRIRVRPVGQDEGEFIEVEMGPSPLLTGRKVSRYEGPDRRVVGVLRENNLLFPESGFTLRPKDRILLLGKPGLFDAVYSLMALTEAHFPLTYGQHLILALPEMAHKQAVNTINETLHLAQNTKVNGMLAVLSEQADIRKELKGWSESLDITIQTADGDLREAALAATRQESAGLMVMPFVKGPRLRSLFRPFTIAYAHELPCPLLVTKSTHPYERILVPFDGTPTAELALELGVDLAGQLNAEVVVAVVREPAFLGGEETRDEWVEELLKKARELSRIHKIQILEKVLEGNPVREITAFAKEFNLLIMASANPKKAFFTPHVGEHLVEEAPCSVLIVTH
ncbi:MAG: universal stress protein [Desulfobacteraceae bacterium]